MSLIAFLACWCVQESNLHARWPQHTNKGLDAWSERLQRHWDPQQLCVTLPISSIITLGARRMDMTVCSRVRVRLIASLCASWCGDTPVVGCVLSLQGAWSSVTCWSPMSLHMAARRGAGVPLAVLLFVCVLARTHYVGRCTQDGQDHSNLVVAAISGMLGLPVVTSNGKSELVFL